MTRKCAAIIAALLTLVWAITAAAQDVTLTSRDGSVSVSGTLLTYDGELYRLDTEYGVLTIDGFKVRCEGPGCPNLTSLVSTLRFSGSRTMGDILMPALVETFAIRKDLSVTRQVIDDTHFEYRLRIPETEANLAVIGFRITSTAEGFADLVAGEADLVLSAREVTPAEAVLAAEAGLGDLTVAQRARIVALDALVPIVSRRNPVRAISLEDLADIFAGQIIDWIAVGGAGPISLHLRDTDSGLADEFIRRVMDPRGLGLADIVTYHPDNASLADAVSRDPLAIGIAGFSDTGNARMLDLLGACGKHVGATSATLKTEDYPLTTPLFIYAPRGRPTPLAREFMSYVRSVSAQPVIARAGFVDLRTQEVPLARQGQRLANAIAAAGGEIDLPELQRLTTALNGSGRLTLSFRFETGGTRLDAQSRSNIEMLGRLLEQGRFDGRTVSFVGFTDGAGDATANLRLARRRAETVRRAVLRSTPAADRERVEIAVEAFGEAMPMACDDTAWGKSVNRRVEIWVK